MLTCCDKVVEVLFAKCPETHKWTRFHTDRGKELLPKHVKDFLVSNNKVAWTHSFTDNP